MVLCGLHSLISIHKTAQLKVSGALRIGYRISNRPMYSSWLCLKENTLFQVDGSFCIVEGAKIVLYKNSKLYFHSGYLSSNVSITCESTIEIGEDATIASGVVIRDCDSHEIVGCEPAKPIKIGNHVWIGTNAIILKGVTIGDGAVIGAGSIVTKDIPSRCLAAGNPAKVIRENVIWR